MLVSEREVEVVSTWKGTTGMASTGGRSVIAVIGIDRYHHWQRLSNAVRDATGAAALFRRLGFEQVAAPLLDDDATGKALQSLVTDDLMTLGPDDSLVLFYAGHGGTRKHYLGDEVIKAGYLIPVDAAERPDKVSTWVDLEGWLRAVALLPPKHILVVLDACHSGIALDPIIKWRDIGTWQDTPLSTLKVRRSRRIITSALDDQVALDGGPVRGHSLFTGCLIEGLTDGIQRDGRRVTTGSELGLYVQRRVQTYPHSRQTPDFGTFAFDDRGEMVISLVTEHVSDPVEAPSTIAEPPAWLDLIDLDDRPELASEPESRPTAAASSAGAEVDNESAVVAEAAPTRPSAVPDEPALASTIEAPLMGAPFSSDVDVLRPFDRFDDRHELARAGDAEAQSSDAAVGAEVDVGVKAEAEAGVNAEPAMERAWDVREARRWELEEQARTEVMAARAELAARLEQEEQERRPRREPFASKRGMSPVPTPALAPSPPAGATQSPPPNRTASIAPTVKLERPTSTELASLPPLTEIAAPTAPTPDARRWIVIGAVGGTLAIALIAYLSFGHESSPSVGTTARVAVPNPSDAPPVDDAPGAVVEGPPDAQSQSGGAASGSCPAGMVPIPAGTFRMGSPDGVGDLDEHPQHEVTLLAYCIDKTEVTVKAYAACVAGKGCSRAPVTVSWSGVSADDVKRYSRFCNRDDHPDHPINCVDWNQATAYCAWAGKRLPTEAEWEYAARGNDGRVYPWGNEPPSAKRLNACGSECVAMAKRELNLDWRSMYDASDGWETTAPVGSFPDGASPFGVLDMAGNVWEWTADWYGPYTAAAAVNPSGAKSGPERVLRGGAWLDNVAGHVRAAFRSGLGASGRNDYAGFRCARGD
ncbi:MAG TPA: SUMF1/EgtB/PvdO family nonheme iron enzyme [Kofleriaceae bacterium]|nr:SUMF1/EgtB/PvdO family nonheme iron enzyme [Kofleriaceae bacterium]